MKTYNCDVCGSLIYFENTLCVNCGSPLGYLPFIDNMSSIESSDGITWRALAPSAQNTLYKKCQNYHQQNVCNWMIPQNTHNDFCVSCDLNETIPDLSLPENRAYWHRIETAKRRLVYSLLRLGLPLRNKKDDPQNGLAFYFLADDKDPELKENKKVLTGHDEGKITLNIAEANDAIREKMRLDMNERYRTLLGHFRHEIGHYYWFLLIENNPEWLFQFRDLFGDEKLDYDESLKHYYKEGASPDWQNRFVSAYASSHPWEDWAESWAHYMHMSDTLETAHSWGLSMNVKHGTQQNVLNLENYPLNFEEMKNQWFHLSAILNSLNRSMGMKDVYPFVWSEPVIKKLMFIQQLIIHVKGDLPS